VLRIDKNDVEAGKGGHFGDAGIAQIYARRNRPSAVPQFFSQ
jgi:hypothetical protein